MKKAGIVVLIIGLVLTIFTAVTYFAREKVVDIGDVHISHNKPHHLSWSPLIGVAVMAAGAVMTLVPFKKI